jgi:hypothetical protein
MLHAVLEYRLGTMGFGLLLVSAAALTQVRLRRRNGRGLTWSAWSLLGVLLLGGAV